MIIQSIYLKIHDNPKYYVYYIINNKLFTIILYNIISMQIYKIILKNNISSLFCSQTQLQLRIF